MNPFYWKKDKSGWHMYLYVFFEGLKLLLMVGAVIAVVIGLMLLVEYECWIVLGLLLLLVVTPIIGALIEMGA